MDTNCSIFQAERHYYISYNFGSTTDTPRPCDYVLCGNEDHLQTCNFFHILNTDTTLFLFEIFPSCSTQFQAQCFLPR